MVLACSTNYLFWILSANENSTGIIRLMFLLSTIYMDRKPHEDWYTRRMIMKEILKRTNDSQYVAKLIESLSLATLKRIASEMKISE